MRAVAVALLVVLPAAFYVYERAQVARTGYLILQLQQEVNALQTQRDRLEATAAALKTPERIERLATAELGMVPPRQQQMAALTLAPVAAAGPVDLGRRSVWDQLRSWLGGQAEAHEAR
jgi:cell division protein FtsL